MAIALAKSAIGRAGQGRVIISRAPVSYRADGVSGYGWSLGPLTLPAGTAATTSISIRKSGRTRPGITGLLRVFRTAELLLFHAACCRRTGKRRYLTQVATGRERERLLDRDFLVDQAEVDALAVTDDAGAAVTMARTYIAPT